MCVYIYLTNAIPLLNNWLALTFNKITFEYRYSSFHCASASDAARKAVYEPGSVHIVLKNNALREILQINSMFHKLM